MVTRPKRGEFEWQPLVSSFEPSAEDMNADRSYFGMPPEALYLWGSLRDDEGDLHTILRRIPHSAASPQGGWRRLVVQSTSGGKDHLAMHSCGRGSAANDRRRHTRAGCPVAPLAAATDRRG